MKGNLWRTAVVMLWMSAMWPVGLVAAASESPPPKGQRADSAREGPTNLEGKERRVLAAFTERVNKLSAKDFHKIRLDLVESLGPGATASSLRLDPGVTFSSIPVAKLTEEEAPGTVANHGLEALSEGGDVQAILPITMDGRVCSQLIYSWNRADDTLLPSEWNPAQRSVMTEQVENARRIHSKATDTPLSAYKGVSFYGLNKHFLYIDKDGTQYMIPIERDPANDFVPGKAEPAGEVLEKLKQIINALKEANAPS